MLCHILKVPTIGLGEPGRLGFMVVHEGVDGVRGEEDELKNDVHLAFL